MVNIANMKALPKIACLMAVHLIAAAASAAPADYWPQWRGPLANGVSATAQPPVKWSETENVKWKIKLPGKGSSTPIIWDNLVFIHTAIPTGKKLADFTPAPLVAAQGAEPPQDRPRRPGGPGGPGGAGGPGGGGGRRGEKPTEEHRFTLLALDRNTGKTVWEKVVREEVPHEGHHQDHAYASSSPVTDGEHVISYFGSRGLHALDLKGQLLWSKDLGRMQTRNGFGEGASPALHGNAIVVNWDHEGEDFIAGLDKKTGRELWRKPREEVTTWGTPLIVEHAGKAQVIVNATRRIVSYDLHTGEVIWECGGMTVNAIPTPVVGHGMAYLLSGFRGNALLAIKLGRTGDLTGTDAIAWRHDKSTPYVPSALLYGERLYFFAGNNAMLSCFNAKDGKPYYEGERLDGIRGVYASPVGAQDRVYLAGRDGGVLVIKNSDKLEILASNRLEDNFDASPALAGKQLFLRGRENLYCLAE